MSPLSDFKVLELEGSPRERGQIHGEEIKSMIWELTERWKSRFLVCWQLDPDKYIDKILEKTNFIKAVKKWAPHLLEEVEGIGEGADIDFNTIFALQLYDELVSYTTWYQKMVKKYVSEQCSALGCFKQDDVPALLAQNGDLASFFDGFQVLQHIKHPDSSLESYIMTYAGMIGLWGMSNQPLGIACNTLGSLNPSLDGLPVAFIMRAVLEQPNLNEAVKFINKIKHASGQNYIIGDSEKVVDYECSANKVVQYVPYKGARRVYHTNHPLVNDDLIFPIPAPSGIGTTHARLDYLEYRMRDPSKKITMESIKNILSSHEGPVCVHNNFQPIGAITMASLIYVLSSSPELHLAPGPPCFTEWKTYKFREGKD